MIKQDTIDTLYHYCSMEKFVNIFQSKQLRMSDIRKSNDFEEVQLFYPYIFDEVEKLYSNSEFPFEYGEFTGLKAVRSVLQDVSKHIDVALEDGNLTSYVVCFCEDGDDLSLWRGYANDGKGCSIGFSMDELRNYCKNVNRCIKIEKVEYCSKSKIKSLIKRKAGNLIRELKALDDSPIKQMSEILSISREEMKMMRIYRKVKNIMIDSLKYKQDCFESEKEWRMYIPDMTKSARLLYGESEDDIIKKHDKTINMMREKIDFLGTDHDLISFFPIELKDNMIKKVICGPKNYMLMSDFNLLMAKKGFTKIGFDVSLISYK